MFEQKKIYLIFKQIETSLGLFLKNHRLFGKIFNNSLWKGVFILGIGSIFATMLGVLSIPIITRLYTPSDLGLLGVFSAILAIGMTFVSLRYEFAIPVPKETKKAENLFILCILLVFLSSSVLLLILIILGNYILKVFNLQAIYPFIWLIPIGFLGTGIYQVFNYWAIRIRDYGSITYTRINQSICGNLSKILFGIIGLGSLGLLLGEIILNITGVGTFVQKVHLTNKNSFKSISFSELKSIAYEYRDFPIFSAPATLIYTTSVQFPIFFLSLHYGIEEVGWYTIAYQALTLPAAFIGNSIAQAFYGEAAKQMNDNPHALKSLYITTVKKLTSISLPIISSVALLAPFLFPIIFGEVWLTAGIYTIPLSLVAISEFIMVPTNKLAIYGYNNWQLFFHIFRFSLILFGFYFSYLLNLNILTTLFIYGIIVAVSYIVLFYLNLLAIHKLISNS